MADILFLALTIGLFALAGLLVLGCDRIIGPAEARVESEPAPLEKAA